MTIALAGLGIEIIKWPDKQRRSVAVQSESNRSYVDMVAQLINGICCLIMSKPDKKIPCWS